MATKCCLGIIIFWAERVEFYFALLRRTLVLAAILFSKPGLNTFRNKAQIQKMSFIQGAKVPNRRKTIH
jgi:hypothetical protein